MIVLDCILSLFYCMIFVFSADPMWYISYSMAWYSLVCADRAVKHQLTTDRKPFLAPTNKNVTHKCCYTDGVTVMGCFLPLTLWGMVGFGIQPWGRTDQVLVHIYSQFQHETSHSPTSST